MPAFLTAVARASCHCEPAVQALIPVFRLTSSQATLTAGILDRSHKAICQCPDFSQALTLALKLTASGAHSRPWHREEKVQGLRPLSTPAAGGDDLSTHRGTQPLKMRGILRVSLFLTLGP